nr:hypothetical protein [Polyangiaceae bacterium]
MRVVAFSLLSVLGCLTACTTFEGAETQPSGGQGGAPSAGAGGEAGSAAGSGEAGSSGQGGASGSSGQGGAAGQAGAAGTSEPGGQGGGVSCEAPEVACPSGCADTASDPKNCGACGQVCSFLVGFEA